MDTRWFVDKLADKQMSQRELARRLDLDSSAVSLTFRGKRKMKLTEAAKIARLLGVPVDEVLHHAGVHEVTRGRMASVVGVIDASGEVRPIDGHFEVDAPDGLPEGAWAIQSRAGDHTDGWLYFIAPPTGIPADAIGRFCVVQIRNGVQLLGRIGRGYVPGRYAVDGPVESADAALEWAAPVLMIQP